MKKRVITAVTTAIVAFGAVGVSAQDNGAVLTARFTVEDAQAQGEEFSMLCESGNVAVFVTADTAVYFQDYVLLDDYGTGTTRDARLVLFGRTLAEVLDGRNLAVSYGGVRPDSHPQQITATRIEILFETAAVPRPEPIDPNWQETPGGEEAAGVTVFADIPLFAEIALNGEIVVNNEMLEAAPAPFWYYGDGGEVVMIPLRAVAEALGYDVSWDEETQSVRVGVGINIWIGRTEAHLGRMAPIELTAAPVVVDGTTFAPIDFFRAVLGQTVYVFEGQVVIETESDMH